LTAIACAALFGAFAAPASASFHLMKIRSLSFGSAAASYDDSFVELQMYETGQNHVNGKEIRIYDGSGNLEHTFTFPSDAGSGQNQRTILVGDTGVAGADFTDSDLSNANNSSTGAACFLNPTPVVDFRDCVAWGTYSDASKATHLLVGTPVAPAGIPDGKAITRSISHGCGTLLEDSDDTNNSSADFTVADPAPRSNATAPTEHTCPPPPTPQTIMLGGPDTATRDRTPTFRFKASIAGSTFGCRIDSKPFAPCSSPKTFSKLGFGKHTFSVRATHSGRTDQTPAVRHFKVVRTRKH
jgi:hypothetical protein